MCVKNARAGGGKQTYESMFYHELQSGKFAGTIKGFPQTIGSWCKKLKFETSGVDIRKYVLSSQQSKEPNSRISDFGKPRELVYEAETSLFTNCSSREREREREPSSQIVQILGIASDEPKRIERHSKRDGVILPLVEIGWTEAMCREWCEQNDLLSPIYTTATRGGCWFCHNQGVDQLRLLRRDYPELWALLLKWDSDSPVTFKPDGHTVHDFDRRFQAEDNGIILPNDRTFRWSQIDGDVQMKFF